MFVLGTNGAVVADGEAPSLAKGTDFGAVTARTEVVHALVISNNAPVRLSITGSSIHGDGAPYFAVQDLPSRITEGGASNFTVRVSPFATGLQTALVALANNGSNQPHRISVQALVVSALLSNTVPANAALDVTQSAHVIAQFREAMATSSFDSTTFFAYSAQRGFRQGTVNFNVADTEATLDLSSDLLPGERVFAEVRAVTNATASESFDHHTWTFYGASSGGSGFFADAVQTQNPTSKSFSVGLGDLNGDGFLDVFVANNGEGNEVWTNDGGGTFHDTGQSLGSSASYGVALGDYDRDGDLDAYVANYNQADRLWTNDGHAMFYAGTQALMSTKNRSAVAGDLNGDGHLDLFIVNEDGSSRIWTNDGRGLFDGTGQWLGAYDARQAAVGDLNGDGWLDVVLANAADENVVYLGNSDGRVTRLDRTFESRASWGIAIGDLDGNGILDAFVANGGDDPNTVWTNNGWGRFYDTGQTLGTNNSRSVGLGDLDADGDLDAYVVNFQQPDTVWLNDGNGIFSDTYQGLGVGAGSEVRLGDVDGDGWIDAFVANAGESNTVWINTPAYCITASAGSHGTIAPEGDVGVAAGGARGFLVAADTYYHIDEVLTNGAPDMAATGAAVYTSVWQNVTANGTVDVSFAEDLAAHGTPHWWLALWGLTNGGLSFDEAELEDFDYDGVNARDERNADTVPVNWESYFYLMDIDQTHSFTIWFACTNSRLYELQYSTNLVSGPWTAVSGQSNVTGDAGGAMSLTDTVDSIHRSYRVGVGLPE